MRTPFPSFPSPRFISGMCLAAAFIFSLNFPAAAQQPVSNSTDMQREAMHKLAFLAGRWSGPVTITQGPAESLHLTQSEDVQYKLGGSRSRARHGDPGFHQDRSRGGNDPHEKIGRPTLVSVPATGSASVN
jgi:hypothetical protein